VREGLHLRELTPAASGGVSVLELRGPGALGLARQLSRRPLLAEGALSMAALYTLREPGELLDEALLWVASEERVELHLHGSPALVERLRRELQLPAEGPASSLEARAWELCHGAASEPAARIFLDQAEGALRRALEQARALPEAQRLEALRRLVQVSEGLGPVLVPPLVALAGPVNAGKSTLFNALVGGERVITHATQGTTRDVIRERALMGGLAFDFVDTAGFRTLGGSAAEELEREGQRRGLRILEQAALVLWLQPAGEPLPAFMPPKALLLLSRAGKAQPASSSSPARISTREDPLGTQRVLGQVLEEALGLPREPWQAGRPVLFDAGCLAGARLALQPGAGALRQLDSLLAR